ncbi:hypothetical protein M9H77_00463 [Catharanthus roseus]|nr:hypothetical protein M9H77_00463 [Catharanthus roseus]
MDMQWNEASRSGRPTYLPPHLRDYSGVNVTIPASLSRSSRFGPARGRGGRGPRGRGRNPVRSWAQPRGNISDPNMNPNFDDQTFDITEKFDELEVIEEVYADANVDAYDETPVETSGFDVPAPVSSFSDLEFSKSLCDNIKRCKFVKPTPIQRYGIPVAMAGRDLMACAQTGSGKTAAFCFPIISGILRDRSSESPLETATIGGVLSSTVASPVALILAPTRELSCQIHEEAKKFSFQTGVKVVVAYGGAPIVQQVRNLDKGVDILVATPGRLVDMIERAKVSLRSIKYLALDEADRMLDMGFEPQIRKLVEQMGMPPPGARQTLLFSATFPSEIQRLASDFLSNYVFLAAGKVGSSTDLIVQKVDFVRDMDKRKHLMNTLHSQRAILTNGKNALTLIFVETKKGADALQHWLSQRGFPSIAIHGDKLQMEREFALRSFKSGVTPILVATDVAARGLDIPHVSHVINYDLPRDIDDYVHRIGRTGRAGKSGLATAFFSDKNLPLASALIELMQEAKQEIPSWLSQYADTSYSSGITPRANRYSGIKFGGHDYRKAAAAAVHYENYDYSDQFVDAPVQESYATTTPTSAFKSDAAGYATSSRLDGFGEGLYNHSYGYGSVVATGWE